jgi:PIN domain nuclease of toxin-antitoxin system
MELLETELHHVRRVGHLPHHHGDPFGRMLTAQAIEEGPVLVPADAAIQRYPVAWLW